MTGVVGGSVTGGDLSTTVDALWQEPWYGREQVETGDVGLGLLHHADRDPESHTVHRDDGRAGVVYGTVSNVDAFEDGHAGLFEALLDRPQEVLPRLDGSFVVAAADRENRLVVATDRLGSRPCLYTTAGGLRFGSEMDAVLTGVDAPTIDEQGISDMLLVGHPWGDHTLVEEVSVLQGATVLEYDGESVTTEQYWSPPSETADPGDAYLDELASRYESAVDACATTLSGDVGLWLSGGLDSRSLAAALSQNSGPSDPIDRIQAYTYDANPKGGGNPELAHDVASSLDVDIEQVEMSPERFLDVVERSVRISGGMLQWNTLMNLSSVFSLDDPDTGVILEGAGQGELIGNHLRQHHFTGVDSVVASLQHSETVNDVRDVCELLAVDHNPLTSFRESVAGSDAEGFAETVLDVHFRNYYARNTLASDQIARSQVGTRVAYLDRSFVEQAARLPLAYRMGTVPLTDGAIPYGVSPAKLDLMRRLDDDLSDITYERTNVPPSWPWHTHVGGFIIGTGVERLRSGQTYGGWTVPGVWYRTQPEFRAYFDSLIDAAKDRRFFDADALERARQTHLDGEADMTNVIAPVTTVELWLQHVLDR